MAFKRLVLILFLIAAALTAACSDDYREESFEDNAAVGAPGSGSAHGEARTGVGDTSTHGAESGEAGLSGEPDSFDFDSYAENVDYLIIAYYGIDDGELSSAVTPDLDEELLSLYSDNSFLSAEMIREMQEDIDLAAGIWEAISGLIPRAHLDRIAYLELFTDGEDDYLGAVEELESRAGYFIFSLDVSDILSSDLSFNRDLLYETIAHELGHMITLAPGQVDWLEEEDSDPGTYFIFEYDLDTRPDSYINLFFNRFWSDIYPEWSDFYYRYGVLYHGEEHLFEKNELILLDYLDDFYNRYSYRFVTDYAATSPAEDIAESFMYFLIRDKPEGARMSDEKVLFFYDFPELVAIRDHARTYLRESGFE